MAKYVFISSTPIKFPRCGQISNDHKSNHNHMPSRTCQLKCHLLTWLISTTIHFNKYI